MATIYGEPQAVTELTQLLEQENIHTFTSIDQIKSTDSPHRIRSQYPYIFSGAQGEKQVVRQLSRLPDEARGSTAEETPIFGPRDQRFSDRCMCHCALSYKGARFLRARWGRSSPALAGMTERSVLLRQRMNTRLIGASRALNRCFV